MEHHVDPDTAEDRQTDQRPARRTGFLPIRTNWFDRLFVGIYLFVALELFWMRFLEQSIPLTVCHVLAIALGVLIVWRG
ncbi:DUF2160 family membrane protein [Shinella yambaruensis]|uniref:DUF2160 family membrane protein n=1 Tax=Shinella TaxID=323620 RepID=UPI00225D3E41|nr:MULTISPECIES: DUF2160 family membrane protein [unclassified Shinella]MCW5705596.1 hypothetical protein [Shinella sp.]MDC7254623.1 DUF2160 domain-containing protein [Shinella sp. YE25]CAI0337347.1 conserved hypothetical protein [Rhizobiaceae bacterium]CAK7255840.1 Small integral membrane protein [Shinella sp. WSC3-e]